MKKLFTLLLCLLLFSTAILAQAKVNAIARKPANTLQKLLTGTGLPFKVVNDSLAAIPYKSENIPSYEVLIQQIGDLYIIYIELTELLPGKIGMISGLFFGFAFGMAGVAAAVLGSVADRMGIDFVYQVCAYLPLIGLLTGLLPDVGSRSRSTA